MSARRTPNLPPPPEQVRDRVNDLGWLSRGPSHRAERRGRVEIDSLLAAEDEPTGLPPDPEEPPALPAPPEQGPDTETRGGRGERIDRRAV